VWKTTVHADGLEVDGRLRASIERQVQGGLEGLKHRIGHVHVRLYGDVEGADLYTCYVRVDEIPSGGVALGDTAGKVEDALGRALARIAAAANKAGGGDWEPPPNRTRAPYGYGFLR
jgi:hypothetical protein